jgi:putative transposase
LSTKTHLLVDGAGMPLVVLVGPGQAGDSPMLPPLLASLRVGRRGPGRPRVRPDSLTADKAYSAAAHRAHLRSHGIKTVIPERSDQVRHRKNRGRSGGRPPAFDADAYKNRNVVERGINRVKHWRGIATRYDKHAQNYRGGIVLASAYLWLKLLGDMT